MRQPRPTYLRKTIHLLQASLAMTPMDDKFIAFGLEEKTELAFSEMGSKNIDHAPLLMNGAFNGLYVNRKDLTNVKGKTCIELAKKVNEKNKIPPNTNLADVLERLTDISFLFVVKNKHLEGIITRSDVNSRPFRTLFYIVLSELESLLVKLIQKRLPCEKHLHLLSKERAKDVLYYYWKAKAANAEISIEQHLSFSDIFHLILKSKDKIIWRLLGCTNRKQVAELKSLVKLRNRVMHSAQSLYDKENPIRNTSQQYKKIWELIEKLT